MTSQYFSVRIIFYPNSFATKESEEDAKLPKYGRYSGKKQLFSFHKKTLLLYTDRELKEDHYRLVGKRQVSVQKSI